MADSADRAHALGPIRGTASPESCIAGERLVTLSSFSHFAELIPLDNPLKRGFLEEQMQAGLVPGSQVKKRRAIYPSTSLGAGRAGRKGCRE